MVSLENLCLAWNEFVRGKRGKPDVQEFERNLSDNLLVLHDELACFAYRHGPYERFTIADPKPRIIHKASVRDRLVHHAVYHVLYQFFDRGFIADSFSCRFGKGTHKALSRFRRMAWKVSRNHTRTCWVLKCDIRKFFASINHGILLAVLEKKISDGRIMALLRNIVESFSTDGRPGVGLPLGNLTSQLFANVYMNEFDQFMKHRLKARRYIRYADDFAVLSEGRGFLEGILPEMDWFLWEMLRLEMHPDKVFIKTIASGVDFLGWVHFPDHRVMRAATKRRMFRRLEEHPTNDTFALYAGLMKHGNTVQLRDEMQNLLWLYQDDSHKNHAGFEP